MRYLVYTILMLLISCTTNRVKDVSHLKPIDRIEYYLSHPDMQDNSGYIITDIGGCKFSFIDNWDKSVSKEKGYWKVQTEIIVEKSNYIKTELELAHRVYNKQTKMIENWEDTLRIRLTDTVKARFTSLSEKGVTKNDRDYVPYSIPFGIKNINNKKLINAFSNAVDELFILCAVVKEN